MTLEGVSESLLTVEQVAARLQVHPRTVRRAIAHGGLRAVQVGERRTWRVDVEDLQAWLDGRANRPRGVVAPAPVPLSAARRVRGGRGVGVLSVPSKAVGQ